jgi:hypothetical protein
MKSNPQENIILVGLKSYISDMIVFGHNITERPLSPQQSWGE